jgi:hypothetical protein
MTISDAIALFLVIALIALVVVIVLGIRMRQWPGPLSAHQRKIRDAAAADVAAIEEDGNFVSPDAPGRQEDDL